MQQPSPDIYASSSPWLISYFICWISVISNIFTKYVRFENLLPSRALIHSVEKFLKKSHFVVKKSEAKRQIRFKFFGTFIFLNLKMRLNGAILTHCGQIT